jgi:hypothetical protein
MVSWGRADVIWKGFIENLKPFFLKKTFLNYIC